MQENNETPIQMGRPKVYGEQVDFEMRKWSKDVIDKIDAQRGKKTRRAYIEYLLRSHPEMQQKEK
jgi:hypothetical protein